MSYILDALRRAEADRERERGQVPGLHTQPLPGGATSAARGGRRWLPWAGGGLLLLAGIGAGSWWASGPSEPAAPAAPAVSPTPAPMATAAAPSPAAPASVAAPVTAPVTALPATPVPQPAASGSPYLPPMPPPEAAARTREPRSGGEATAAAPAPAPAPDPAPEARIPTLSELPEATRRELPRLAIGGSVYSDDPASRLVIVNGEVLHEGARLGSDLVLEQIRPRELVLRFKGQRYRQPV
ncbi:general secretion pathway protein GspB [Pelomonas sp. P7]|uniref:General secretion pathway protein GspB n=1 Tax=Pelomonas caseinilytica TaxID=2906763 RepID=A0ABS8X909_9BURK|nr:general secretion pathway protein GspB [Pelomonas sp. P7]MCE4537274.1 general secretion pathway protein GspB [Pelomonas sp. P7]